MELRWCWRNTNLGDKKKESINFFFRTSILFYITYLFIHVTPVRIQKPILDIEIKMHIGNYVGVPETQI